MVQDRSLLGRPPSVHRATADTASVVVLGAGAMGCLFGARLAESGHHVVLVDVRADQVDAINARGLRVEENGSSHVVSVAASLADKLSAPADWIVLFTKAFASEAALAGAIHAIGDHTWILTLQNGLGHVEVIQRYVDPHRIVVGTTTIPSDIVGLGHVRTHGSGSTKIMSVEGGVTDRLRALASALTAARLPCEISERVWESIWEKLAFNAAMNSLTAVTGLTVGQVGRSPAGAALADRVAAEVTAVAQRQGIGADLAAVRREIAMAFRDHADHKPSMLQDVMAKRPTEIEHINGAVAREASRLGISVPSTEALYQLVRMLEDAYP
jgi:2-dehydropantoate 2-reductase